MYRSVVS